jgi:hypothetical protein
MMTPSFEQLHAVNRFHFDVGDQQVEFVGLQGFFCHAAVLGQLHIVSLGKQYLVEQAQYRRIVIRYEYFGHPLNFSL